MAEYICPECLQCGVCEKVLPLSQYDRLVHVQIEKDGRRWHKTPSCIVCKPPSSGCIGCGKYPTELKRGGINFAEYICPECLQCRGCKKVLPLAQYDEGVHKDIQKMAVDRRDTRVLHAGPRRNVKKSFHTVAAVANKRLKWLKR